ncbi:VCBS repeat-containing protein [Micromonospora sp. BRA006-A]|nr:VCBS repeat-containing protein [Micromonospora sp. BRA006-A]
MVAPGEIWNSTTANVLDVDGDGGLDILIGNYFPDGARVLDRTAADDPVMRMQDSMSLGRNGGRNRLLMFDGNTPAAGGAPVPAYADRSDAFTTGQARAWTLATGAQDLTGDGLPEIYFANDFGPDNLLVNESRPGRPEFREVSGTRDPLAPKSKVIGHDSFKGMGVAFDDLNSDGRPDLLVSNITSPFALQESNFAFVSTGGRFTSGARRTGTAARNSGCPAAAGPGTSRPPTSTPTAAARSPRRSASCTAGPTAGPSSRNSRWPTTPS